MKVPIFLTRVGWAAVEFRRQRADYYDYLADIITATEGRQTLRRIFERDAVRYGTREARGVLAAHWSYRIAETGSLQAAWADTLPAEDVALVGNLQRIGADALVHGLRDLAALTRLRQQLGEILRGTLWAAGIAVLVMVAMLCVAVPYYTVPQLQATFDQIPAEQLGPLTRRLFGLADALRAYPLVLAGALSALGAGTLWALPNLRGPARRWLDRWGPFRLYRDVAAIRVVAALAIAVRQRAEASLVLLDAISMQMDGASPWLTDHLRRMLYRLGEAHDGVAAFDTGLLDRNLYWYLADTADAVGLDAALQRVRTRLETTTLALVARRAGLLRWVLVLGAVATLVGLLLWHYGVIFELRNQMLLMGV